MKQNIVNINLHFAILANDSLYFMIAHGTTPHSSSTSVYNVDPIIIYSASVNVTVNVGESYNFSCNATNTVYRQWQYIVPSEHPRVMSNTTDGRVVVTSDFELQLRDIRFEDAGTYRCMFNNNLRRLSLTNILSVIGKNSLPGIRGIASYFSISSN